jgi:ABC-type molybdate transport system substrate-binding protein
MFHHIVLFSWNDKVPSGYGVVAAQELRAYASTLGGLISYHCGENLGLTAGAADFAVSAVFEDDAAWHAYDIADEHNRIRAEIFQPYVAQRTVIQFRS